MWTRTHHTTKNNLISGESARLEVDTALRDLLISAFHEWPKHVLLGAMLISILLGGCASKSTSSGPAISKSEPSCRELEEQGWASLFNGRDLTGWVIPEGDGGHWRVINGVIDYDALSEAKGEKSLWTERSFEDFKLHVDWRLKGYAGMYTMPIVQSDGTVLRGEDGEAVTLRRPNADSGILLRGPSGAQANIWNWPIGSGEVYGYRTDENMPPEVRAAVTPRVRADRPVGMWNTFVITMRDNQLTVELNGTTVIKDARLPGVSEEGPIGFQHHGGVRDGELLPASSLVQFRDICIKEL